MEPAIAALGVPYRAQHPIFASHHIVDFALLDERIVIEIDGSSHTGAAAKEKDRARTLAIEKFGWVVVRCTNAEAQRDPGSTLQLLLAEARDRRSALKLLNPN
jgi:very-short-patch-repair endonuclease